MAGIYIHIPFCKKRCIYCDFYSTTMEDKKDDYIDAVCKEMDLRNQYLPTTQINTIYLGGGTPSQLQASHFEKLFTSLYKSFNISADAEITIEVNPDDITPKYLALLRLFPFNRVSMGIQTFNDEMLKKLNRRHSATEAIDAYRLIRKYGYSNVSIDLMYGLPGESLNQWINDIHKAIELVPEHISAYHLIYEEGTKLWELKQQLSFKEIDEDLSLKMFTSLIDELKAAGYQHYEISNFCLTEKYSRHNSSYWEDIPYLGLGASAHSYNGESRQWNVSSLQEYIEKVEAGNSYFETEMLDSNTKYNDCVLTSLRTCKGLDLNNLKVRFGEKLYLYCLAQAQKHIKTRNLGYVNQHLCLTRQGIFISDSIMSDLMWVND